MRTITPFVVSLLLAACHAVDVPADADGLHEPQVVDASYHRVVPSPMDSTAARVVSAMETAYELQRRVMLENLCNVDTPGFKRRIAQVVTESPRSLGNERVAIGRDHSFQSASALMPRVHSVVAEFSAGALESTGRSLDLAIDGYGFFSVVCTDGSTRYLRDGRLQLDADGKLVTLDGYVLTPEITIPTDTLDLVVTPQGRVLGRTAGSPDTATTFGQLTIHRFVNANGLMFEGRLYSQSKASGRPVTATPGQGGLGHLRQGFLECSNVEMPSELRRLQELEQRHRTVMQVLEQEGLLRR